MSARSVKGFNEVLSCLLGWVAGSYRNYRITRPMDRADPRLSLRIVPASWSLEWAIRDLSGGVTLTSSFLCP